MLSEVITGHVNPGESSEILEFTIENSGADNLELSGTPVVTVSGANASDFVVDQTSISSTVLPAETTTFTIVFTPSASGSRIAEISINNNDADENPYNFTVTGNDSSNFVLENISDSIRITSYNVCYTKLLRRSMTWANSEK